MPRHSSAPITQLLQQLPTGDQGRNELLSAVYEELRSMARRHLRNERSGHTLQATALVHEAYLKLMGPASVSWMHREHFFGACANAMRQILVEHARQRKARKRGGGIKPEALSNNDVADTADLDLILSVDGCLERLRGEDPRSARIVELRFFAGLDMKDIGEILHTSERTVQREWAFARARLLQFFGGLTDSAR